MVSELRELMHDTVADPPGADHDLRPVLVAGRRRVRRRRVAVVGAAALATAAVVTTTSVLSGGGGPGPAVVVDQPPRPDAPTLALSDAEDAVRGEDYRVLASYTNESLDRANGQYLDGMTDDGMVLLSDGPHGVDNRVRLALMDPATGEKQWLPDSNAAADQLWPLALGRDHLLFVGAVPDGDLTVRLVAYDYDRQRQRWSGVKWPDLAPLEAPDGVLGPDGRLYVRVAATQGQPPPGGWPTSAGGEADEADASGDTYHLWSVSLTDGSDVRDEGLTVGDVAFTDTAMVWTDATNGDAGRVHVRDLTTGEEHAFDPHAGERCNLLSLGAVDDRVVMGQYCGTYGRVRDDRVQVLSTDGDQVVTIQGSGLDGGLANDAATGVVAVRAYVDGSAGTYAYDLGTDRFLRLSDAVSHFALGGGPTPAGRLLWDTPVNHGHGATQWLGELVG